MAASDVVRLEEGLGVHRISPNSTSGKSSSLSAAQETNSVVEPEPVDNEKQATQEAVVSARNWSRRRKVTTTWVVSMFKFISGLTSTSIVPNLPAIANQFHTQPGTLTIFPLSTYFLGYAAGLLLIGPLSETFGRVGALQLSNLSFIVFSTAAGFSQTNAQIIVLRVLIGFGGAGPLSLGGGILNDCFTPEERTSMIAVYALSGQLSPALGPILGAICDRYLDWRWTFWIVSLVSFVLQAVCFLTVQETYKPVLERRHEKRIQVEANGETFQWWEIRCTRKDLATTRQALATNTARPFKMLATHPIVQLISISNGLTYGIQMLVTASLDQLWKQPYHQPTILAALNYLALGVGLVFGAQICRRLNQLIYRRLKKRNEDKGQPEFRIPMIAAGTVIVPLGLLWYGWSAQARVFPLVPDLGVFVLAIGLVTILNCTSLYLVDTYKLQSASATGAVNLLRSLAGFAFPLFSKSLYDSLGQGWANTLLAEVTLLIGCPIPFILWRYGERMRSRLNE